MLTLRNFLAAIALIPVLALLFSGLSFLHPLADSIAIFRVPLGGLNILAGAALWLVWGRFAGLSVIALGVAAAVPVILSPYTDTAVPEGGYRLYQKNMLYRAPSLVPLQNDIIARRPDFVTLQEVSQNNRPILAALRDSLPSSNFCRFANVGGAAVLSRFALIDGSKICDEQNRLAAMQVQTPDGPVWVVSLHLRWPYPYRQAAQVQNLLPVLRGLAGKLVLGGDFNMVPWSQTMSLIESATGAVRVGHVNNTFKLKGWYPMPIDHVLAPVDPAGQVESLPFLGSDHRGVLARFSLK